MSEPASVCQSCLQTVPKDQMQDHQQEHIEATESAKGQEFQSMLGIAASTGFGEADKN